MSKLINTLGIILITALVITSCEDYGNEKNFNGVQLFYTSNVTEAEANSLGNYLIESGFADGGQKSVQLNKTGKTYEFRMVVKTGIEQDPEYTELGKLLAAEISSAVFNGESVDVHYCDEYFNTLRVLPMATY